MQQFVDKYLELCASFTFGRCAVDVRVVVRFVVAIRTYYKHTTVGHRGAPECKENGAVKICSRMPSHMFYPAVPQLVVVVLSI
jgi:hypothetical protein